MTQSKRGTKCVERLAQESLFHENMGLAYFTLHRYFPDLSQDEDWQQVALLGLWKACMRYDTGREIAFSTFAVVCIKNEVLRNLRYETKCNRLNTTSLSCIIGEEDTELSELIPDKNALDDVVYMEIFDSLENAKKKLSEKEKSTLKYLLLGYSQCEIAPLVGVTQAHISRLTKSIKRKAGYERESV